MFRSRSSFGLVAAVFAAGVVLSSPVNATTSNIFQYTTPKTGFLAISPMDMAPDGNSSAGGYFVSWSSQTLTVSASGCFETGVNLPQGATITALTYTHTNAVFISLQDVPVGVGPSATLASETAPVAAGRNTRTLVISPGVKVKNAGHAYGLGVCLTSGLSQAFFGARISYTFTQAGD